MELSEVRRMAEAWVENRGKYCEAWDALTELCLNQPEAALRVIEEIHHRATNQEPIDYPLMGALAAGPLEDLLAHNGEKVIEQIQSMAHTDPEFRKCLTGVWQNAMSHELFAKVQRAADPNFKLKNS